MSEPVIRLEPLETASRIASQGCKQLGRFYNGPADSPDTAVCWELFKTLRLWRSVYWAAPP